MINLEISIIIKVLIAGFIFFAAIYGFFIEPNMLTVTKYSVKDVQLKGVKIVMAGDFHIKPHQQKRLKKIVNLINEQNADLVLSVGDYVSGHNLKMTMPIENIASELKKVKSKYGFYTVLGNHDSCLSEKTISESLVKNGIKVLNNSNSKVNINGKEIYIAGVEDLTTGTPYIYKAIKDAKPPIVLLSHSPDVFSEVPKGINLTLTGHVHGGQVRLPFVGALIVPSVYGNKYSQGLIVEKDRKMIVTKGIGTSIIPVRFNCIPEIVVIEFE